GRRRRGAGLHVAGVDVERAPQVAVVVGLAPRLDVAASDAPVLGTAVRADVAPDDAGLGQHGVDLRHHAANDLRWRAVDAHEGDGDVGDWWSVEQLEGVVAGFGGGRRGRRRQWRAGGFGVGATALLLGVALGLGRAGL